MKTVREIVLSAALVISVDSAFLNQKVVSAVGSSVAEFAVWSQHAFRRGAVQQGWWF